MASIYFSYFAAYCPLHMSRLVLILMVVFSGTVMSFGNVTKKTRLSPRAVSTQKSSPTPTSVSSAPAGGRSATRNTFFSSPVASISQPLFRDVLSSLKSTRTNVKSSRVSSVTRPTPTSRNFVSSLKSMRTNVKSSPPVSSATRPTPTSRNFVSPLKSTRTSLKSTKTNVKSSPASSMPHPTFSDPLTIDRFLGSPLSSIAFARQEFSLTSTATFLSQPTFSNPLTIDDFLGSPMSSTLPWDFSLAFSTVTSLSQPTFSNPLTVDDFLSLPLSSITPTASLPLPTLSNGFISSANSTLNNFGDLALSSLLPPTTASVAVMSTPVDSSLNAVSGNAAPMANNEFASISVSWSASIGGFNAAPTDLTIASPTVSLENFSLTLPTSVPAISLPPFLSQSTSFTAMFSTSSTTSVAPAVEIGSSVTSTTASASSPAFPTQTPTSPTSSIASSSVLETVSSSTATIQTQAPSITSSARSNDSETVSSSIPTSQSQIAPNTSTMILSVSLSTQTQAPSETSSIFSPETTSNPPSPPVNVGTSSSPVQFSVTESVVLTRTTSESQISSSIGTLTTRSLEQTLSVSELTSPTVTFVVSSSSESMEVPTTRAIVPRSSTSNEEIRTSIQSLPTVNSALNSESTTRITVQDGPSAPPTFQPTLTTEVSNTVSVSSNNQPQPSIWMSSPVSELPVPVAPTATLVVTSSGTQTASTIANNDVFGINLNNPSNPGSGNYANANVPSVTARENSSTTSQPSVTQQATDLAAETKAPGTYEKQGETDLKFPAFIIQQDNAKPDNGLIQVRRPGDTGSSVSEKGGDVPLPDSTDLGKYFLNLLPQVSAYDKSVFANLPKGLPVLVFRYRFPCGEICGATPERSQFTLAFRKDIQGALQSANVTCPLENILALNIVELDSATIVQFTLLPLPDGTSAITMAAILKRQIGDENSFLRRSSVYGSKLDPQVYGIDLISPVQGDNLADSLPASIAIILAIISGVIYIFVIAMFFIAYRKYANRVKEDTNSNTNFRRKSWWYKSMYITEEDGLFDEIFDDEMQEADQQKLGLLTHDETEWYIRNQQC